MLSLERPFPQGCEFLRTHGDSDTYGDDGEATEVMKMTGAMEASFKLALKKPPSVRTAEVNNPVN